MFYSGGKKMDIQDKIRQKSIEYEDYTIRNLSELVAVRSFSGDEEKVINRLAGMLKDADFDEVRIDGLGNLIGRVGKGEKILVFDAHIDTVDTGDPDQWENDPFCGEVKDGWVHGRGAADQKGGAASMITAGRIIRELDCGGNFSVYFTFTVMEEDCEGLCWNYIIEQEKLVPDIAVLTEPTDLAIYRGHRGRMEIELYFKGKSAHGSAPERGDNAVYKASDAVQKIREMNGELRTDDFLGKGSVAVTHVASGSPSLCAIPDRCMIHLDRRLTWGETAESALEEARRAAGGSAKAVLPLYDKRSYRGTLFSQEKYFPTWKLPEDHRLVRAGVDTCRSLFNEEPRIGKWTFSTNGVSISGKHGIPVIGFGPGNEIHAHAPGERIRADHLEKAAAFYSFLPTVLGRD